LSRGSDVVPSGSYLELIRRQHGRRLVPGPGEVVAIVVEADIGVLTRRITTFGVRRDVAHPSDDAASNVAIALSPECRVRVAVGSQELGVVVGHLLEVGHDPLRIDAVAVETAAQVVANAAARHAVERSVDHSSDLGPWIVPPTAEQELNRSGVGELG